MGCGAHLTALRRTSSGEFDLSAALEPSKLEALATRRQLRERLIPLAELDMGLPCVTVREASLGRVAQGGSLTEQDLEGPIPPAGPVYRVLAPSGELVAVAEMESQGTTAWIQPKVVLLRPDEIPVPVLGVEA